VSWTLTVCLIDNNGYPWADMAEPITRCDDGSYCCGPQSVGTPYCDSGSGFWIVNGTESNEKPSTTSSIAIVMITTTPTDDSCTSSDMDGTVAGGGIRGALGLAILLGMGQFYFFRRI
jgi:hypothetical protein